VHSFISLCAYRVFSSPTNFPSDASIYGGDPVCYRKWTSLCLEAEGNGQSSGTGEHFGMVHSGMAVAVGTLHDKAIYA
jgi:hypothetical protein